MQRTLLVRIIIFIVAMAGVGVLIALAARSTWQKIRDLGQTYTDDLVNSLSSPNQFRNDLQNLDNLLLRYQIKPESNQLGLFNASYHLLDDWIDQQRAFHLTNQDKLRIAGKSAADILAEIDSAYTNYGKEASAFIAQVDANSTNKHEIDWGGVDKASDTLRDLGYKLNNLQQLYLTRFLEQSRASLFYFRNIIFAIMLAFLAVAIWLGVGIYQAMISPLRLRLVASQEIIERHEKLASLGMLAAGVAHEIRNPLTAIKAWLFMHKKHLLPGTPEFSDAEVISREIDRLERIVRDFLQFARPAEPQRETVSAMAPFEEIRDLMRAELEKTNIRLELEGAEKLDIRVDPAQLKQVLINLVQNAADSIGQNGVITLRARRQNRHLSGRSTEAVVLEVKDTGKGIPPEVEKRLFDPFFTTKESGTGLGLSIAARIVEKHGGLLQYQTQVNHGTTFGIVLPRA